MEYSAQKGHMLAMVQADSLKEEVNWSKVNLLRHNDLPQDDIDKEGEKQVAEYN